MPEVLFEFRRVGNAMKVTAIDSQSGVEVSIVASAVLDRHSLQQAATRKLQ